MPYLPMNFPKLGQDFEVYDYKKIKELKKENLRDNRSNLELVLTMLVEASTTEISKENNPIDFTEAKIVAKKRWTSSQGCST
jgi:hypothetical protein